DGDAVFGNRQHSSDPTTPKLVSRNDPTSWHLWWTAPQAGLGPLTIYAAVVDGNGGSGTSVNDQDPFGDDTVQASVLLQEIGMPVPVAVGAGCSMAGSSAPLATPAA